MSLATITVGHKTSTTQTFQTTTHRRTIYFAVSVVGVKIHLTSLARIWWWSTNSILNSLTCLTTNIIDRRHSRSTAQAEPCGLIDSITVLADSDALTIRVDKMVKRAGDTWEVRIGSIARSALTLDQSVPGLASTTVKNIGETETMLR